MSQKKLYHQYIDGVLDGSIIVGQNMKLCVNRHLEDLKRQNTPDFPYYFDEKKADQVINFIGELRLTGGSFRGKKWKEYLQPVQAFYFACVYGWLKQENGFRRFRKVYWSSGRKAAKSEKTAGEEIYHLAKENDGNPEIYCAATTSEQAGYVYKAARTMALYLIRDSEKAAQKIRVKQYEIVNTELNEGGFIKCLTGDASTQDGGNTQFGSIDEFHAHDNSDIEQVVDTSMAMRNQPLLKITTTAGFNLEGPDFSFRKHCERVLRSEVKDENLFIMIFDMDPEDDWNDEKNWPKPNPMIGLTPKWDYMRSKYLEAVNEGGEKLTQFLTKNLNKYVGSSDIWINLDRYKSAANFIDREELRGKTCIISFDLASEHDTTAVNYLFPEQEGLEKMYYFTVYYCPSTKFKKVRTDGVLYSEYLSGGWMIKTPGEVINKEIIANDILDACKMFNVPLVGHDPHKAVDLITKLEENDIPCAKVPQTAFELGAGYSEWKERILSNRVEHDGNPVTQWQMGNIEMYIDGNGNQKIIKSRGKKEKKVDGPVAIGISFRTYLHWKREMERELTIDDLGVL